jgi:hypothetical protein
MDIETLPPNESVREQIAREVWREQESKRH